MAIRNELVEVADGDQLNDGYFNGIHNRIKIKTYNDDGSYTAASSTNTITSIGLQFNSTVVALTGFSAQASIDGTTAGPGDGSLRISVSVAGGETWRLGEPASVNLAGAYASTAIVTNILRFQGDPLTTLGNSGTCWIPISNNGCTAVISLVGAAGECTASNLRINLMFLENYETL